MADAKTEEEKLLADYEAAQKTIADSRKGSAAKRRLSRMREFVEKVAPVLADDIDLMHFEIEDGGGAEDVSGWIVYRRPTAPEYKRWRYVKFSTSQDRGAKDARDKCDREIAEACVVYPSAEVYASTCAAFPATPDLVTTAVLLAAQAHADAEGKG